MYEQYQSRSAGRHGESAVEASYVYRDPDWPKLGVFQNYLLSVPQVQNGMFRTGFIEAGVHWLPTG